MTASSKVLRLNVVPPRQVFLLLVLSYLQEILSTEMVFFTRAHLVSAAEVRCEMPFSIVDIEIRWSRITWLVSVSNDNVTFSNATKVFVFDSKCLTCTSGPSSCRQKVSFLC